MEGVPPVVFVPTPKAGSSRNRYALSRASASSSDVWIAPRPKWSQPLRNRSRSPSSRALPGLRELAPGRLARGKAQAPDLEDEEVKTNALKELLKDTKARSTHGSDDSRLATMEGWLKRWGLQMYPPTIASYKAIAATLKAGGYKSAAVYLQVYRVSAERLGYATSSLDARHLKDFKKSCLRGLGGPTRPRPLPLESLGSLPCSRSPWCADGPLNPRAAIIAGSWWLCREIELSTSRARLLEILVPPDGVPSARWHLPASKSDTEAVGMARSLFCACEVVGRPACPVHCLWDHVCFLQHRFPHEFVDGLASWDFPLFPTEAGKVVTKHAMATTIMHAAINLQVPLSAPDGSERVSGHSLRVSGAQGLARLGWDLWAIQLHGRWQSDIVKHYVRDAHLSPAGVASGLVDPLTLELVVRRVVQKLGSVSQVGLGGVPSSSSPALPQPEQLHCIIAAEQPNLSEEKELLPEFLVLHSVSGIYHRRPERSSIRTACGWSFGDSGLAVDVPDGEAGPQAWFQLCCRCWPSARAAAKSGSRPLAIRDSSS